MGLDSNYNIHTYIHIIHTYIHTFVRTYIHTYIHTYILYKHGKYKAVLGPAGGRALAGKSNKWIAEAVQSTVKKVIIRPPWLSR